MSAGLATRRTCPIGEARALDLVRRTGRTAGRAGNWLAAPARAGPPIQEPRFHLGAEVLVAESRRGRRNVPPQVARPGPRRSRWTARPGAWMPSSRGHGYRARADRSGVPGRGVDGRLDRLSWSRLVPVGPWSQRRSEAAVLRARIFATCETRDARPATGRPPPRRGHQRDDPAPGQPETLLAAVPRDSAQIRGLDVGGARILSISPPSLRFGDAEPCGTSSRLRTLRRTGSSRCPR
jgi:hypothetical protein